MSVKPLNYENIYFVGIGGIGMSALARYFAQYGKAIRGYDRVKTELTTTLEQEGMSIHYEDNIQYIDADNWHKDNTLIIYTPAIPKEHSELQFFRQNDYTLLKRAETLGYLSRQLKTIGIAGTHGKTSISTMCAFLLSHLEEGCNAFLGGISKNFNSNLLFSKASQQVVVEADEFDRSFLQLFPEKALISAMDADHLDIYGEEDAIKESFFKFIQQIQKGGSLIYKYGLSIPQTQEIQCYSYSLNDANADYYAKNIILKTDQYQFDLVTPEQSIQNIDISVPGLVNLENMIGASALALQSGLSAEQLKQAIPLFLGVRRRFDYRLKTDHLIYIDDYAHHPEEIKAFVGSVKELYPNRKITGVFQPHLYSRTQDFAEEFAQALDLLDEVFLLDIYPARELPIEGVTSELIFNKMTNQHKQLCSKENLLDQIQNYSTEVLVTMGAGNIDQLVQPLEDLLKNRI